MECFTGWQIKITNHNYECLQRNPVKNPMSLLRWMSPFICVELWGVRSPRWDTPEGTFTRLSHGGLSSTPLLRPECNSKWRLIEGDGCMLSPQVTCFLRNIDVLLEFSDYPCPMTIKLRIPKDTLSLRLNSKYLEIPFIHECGVL